MTTVPIANLDKVYVLTGTTGNGAIALGAAVSAQYLTEVEAGAVGGKSYHLHVDEGDDFEIVPAVYTASGRVMTIGTPIVSKIGGTVSTAKMSLAGNARVRVVTTAEALARLVSIDDASETTVASAATCDIGNIDTLRAVVSGAVTVTSFGSRASVLRIVRFSGAPLLTHNATSLILPGGGNIQAAAGDTAIFASDPSGNWRCYLPPLGGGRLNALFYSSDGVDHVSFNVDQTAKTAAQKAQARANIDAEFPQFQCRLDYVSTTQLQLNRKDGNRIFINGKHEIVPSSGPTLANTGLTAGNFYYIYAYMNSGTLTLEASATAFAIDTTYGHQTKSGDATRVLVGAAFMDSGTPGTFADSVTNRWTRTWFNRKPKGFYASGSGSTSSAMAEWTGLTLDAILWADESIDLSWRVSGYYSSGTHNFSSRLYISGAGTGFTTNVSATNSFFGVAPGSYVYRPGALGRYYFRIGVGTDADTINFTAAMTASIG